MKAVVITGAIFVATIVLRITASEWNPLYAVFIGLAGVALMFSVVGRLINGPAPHTEKGTIAKS